MSETNLSKSERERPKPLPTNPTEMLRFQCQQLQHQNQLLAGIQSELQMQRKSLDEHMKALNKHTKYLSNISTAVVLWTILIVLGVAISLCAQSW